MSSIQRLTDNQLLILLAIRRSGIGSNFAEIRRIIRSLTGREVPKSRVHDALMRFEKSEWLTTRTEASPTRRGKRLIKIYKLTTAGSAALSSAEADRHRARLIR